MKGTEMREDHHNFEAHNESAADHFCDQCFGYHHWNAGCPEDDSLDEELIDFEQVMTNQLRVPLTDPAFHEVTTWRVPSTATTQQIEDAMRYWIEATFCQHEYDCCGNYYARAPQLLGRTYDDGQTDLVFVLQTHSMNV